MESPGAPSNEASPNPNKEPSPHTDMEQIDDPSEDALDPLMTHILEHLCRKGYHSAAQELQNELDTKSNQSDKHNSRKRSYSEMAADSQTDDEPATYLQNLYENFSSTLHTAADHDDQDDDDVDGHRTLHHLRAEHVMSAQDLSLGRFGEYEQLFTSSHKSSVSCIAFSSDGLFAGIGCVDGSVRIFDVTKLHQSSNVNSLIKKYDSNSYSDIHRPLIASFNLQSPAMLNLNMLNANDTQYAVNEIDFYPQMNVHAQVCCCYDGGIAFHEFDAAKARNKAIGGIEECFNVRSAQFHACGEFVIAGGDSCYVRLYDIQKEQGYIAQQNDDSDFHINRIRCSLNGNVFAACTSGGDVRFYDGRSMKVVNVLKKWHRGKAVSSIEFSKDGKYLLSAGSDELIRLCDLRKGKQVRVYRGCSNESESEKEKQQFTVQACFTFDDAHVLAYSNGNNRIFVYDTNTAHRITKFKQHAGSDAAKSNVITYLAASPTETAFMCGTADNKSRFYATIKHLNATANANGAEIANERNNEDDINDASVSRDIEQN
mmetsp:Transcript_11254/g.18070  ORF Transcript_11254/g.18070 Transcript_11254/m.18070 type:complete len:543 (+) Transcript_11254:70-1698(+)